MVAKITQLIDKQDSYELIRDEIAAILAVEEANQRVLAVADNQDPNLYKFTTYTERFHPWELLVDTDGQPTGQPPLVNVSFDTMTEKDEAQTAGTFSPYSGIFNIDCCGAKNTKELSQGVHAAGDELTARESQRIARLVRNIFAYNEYARLGIPDIVAWIRVKQLNSLQPNIQDRPSNNIMVTRIMLMVGFNEFDFNTVPVDLELVSNQCIRQDDGLIYFKADFDYTQP
jgi:hypothetical protein